MKRPWPALVLAVILLVLTACGGPAAAPAASDGAAGRAPDAPDGPVADAGPAPALPLPAPATEDPPDPPAPPEPAPPPPLEVAIEYIGGPVVAIDEAEADRRLVMLTYDDGPNPGTTDKVLDALRDAGVKAVFFVTGYGARHEELLRRIHDEGHTIGTHTANHLNLSTLSKEEQRAEIVPVNETVARVTGQPVKYLRPPFGAYNQDTIDLAEELGLQLINWTHGSRDWEPGVTLEDPALVTAKVLAEEPAADGDTALWPGAVILLHDTLPWTAEASPDFIAGLLERGYEPVVLR